MPILRLTVSDHVGPTQWRWVLSDSQGCFLADQGVHWNPTRREYGGFRDLSAYLDYHAPIAPVGEQLGRGIGERVFGGRS